MVITGTARGTCVLGLGTGVCSRGHPELRTRTRTRQLAQARPSHRAGPGGRPPPARHSTSASASPSLAFAPGPPAVSFRRDRAASPVPAGGGRSSTQLASTPGRDPALHCCIDPHRGRWPAPGRSGSRARFPGRSSVVAARPVRLPACPSNSSSRRP